MFLYKYGTDGLTVGASFDKSGMLFLKSGMSFLKSGVSFLKRGVTFLKSGATLLKSGVTPFKSDATSGKSRVISGKSDANRHIFRTVHREIRTVFCDEPNGIYLRLMLSWVVSAVNIWYACLQQAGVIFHREPYGSG